VTVPPGPKLAALSSFARVFAICDPLSVQLVWKRVSVTLPTRIVWPKAWTAAHKATAAITSFAADFIIAFPLKDVRPPAATWLAFWHQPSLRAIQTRASGLHDGEVVPFAALVLPMGYDDA
jgi:hypothetical protein